MNDDATDARGLLATLSAAWATARLFVGVLWLVRVSIAVVIVCVLALFSGQGQEVLRALGQNLGVHDQHVALLGTSTACALAVWYAASVMLRFQFTTASCKPDVFPRLKRHLPRGLGLFLLLGIVAALATATHNSAARGTLAALTAAQLAVTTAFALFVTQRRRWFRLSSPQGLASTQDLPAGTRRAVLLALGFSILLGSAITLWPHEIAVRFGTAGLLLAWGTSLASLGSAIAYVGERSNVPTLFLLVLLGAGASFWNDNHHVRQTPEMHPRDASSATVAEQLRGLAYLPGIDPARPLETYFAAWLRNLARRHEGEPVPVVLVSAEGGGIRAAYWTALVLANLQDRGHKHGVDFARHVFAISGVSGGSLGAATFAALVATSPPPAQPARAFRARVDRILRRDFLAPTVAVMLFPDALQRLIPYPIFTDRAVALEQAWERAWDVGEAQSRFAQPFDRLWSGYDPFAVPLLFLNSAVVETGERVLVQPLPFADAGAFDTTFSNAIDAAQMLGPKIPLSTAVHMSARFTYVSPAGTIERHDEGREGKPARRWLRVVDGGYFENSGAITTEELLLAIQSEEVRQRVPGVSIRPIIVHISNDPITSIRVDPALDSGTKFLSEVTDPPEALLASRPARGYQARDALARRVRWERFVHFRLCQYDVDLPLGWMLGKGAVDEMNRQMGVKTLRGGKTQDAGVFNQSNAGWLLSVLGAPGAENPKPGSLESYENCEGTGRPDGLYDRD